MPDHPLRREIVATVLANRVVNDLGITFVNRLMNETGATCDEIVAAYRVAHRMIRAQERWLAIEMLDAAATPAMRRMLLDAIDRLVETITRWYLTGGRELPNPGTVEALNARFEELEKTLPSTGSPDRQEDRARRIDALVRDGVPADIATRHVFHEELEHAPDIIDLASRMDRDIAEVAHLFLLVGARYHLDWLDEQARRLSATTRWQRWALRGLEGDIAALRCDLAAWVLAEADAADPTTAIEKYGAARNDRHARLDQFIHLVTHEGGTDLDSLIVAVRQIRALAG